MNVCDKCQEGIRQTLPVLDRNTSLLYMRVSESGCEFPTHKVIHEVKKLLEIGSRTYGHGTIAVNSGNFNSAMEKLS